MNRKKREAQKKQKNLRRGRRRYYEAPKAWSHRCKDCEAPHAAVLKPEGQVYLCRPCAVSRGVTIHPAKTHETGGAQTDTTVRVRFVDPRSIEF